MRQKYKKFGFATKYLGKCRKFCDVFCGRVCKELHSVLLIEAQSAVVLAANDAEVAAECAFFRHIPLAFG